MRTTLTIEEDLARQLAELARELKKPFKVVVNDALRRGLADRTLPEPGFQLISHPGRLRVGIDDRRFNELAWEDDSKEPLPSSDRNPLNEAS